MDSPLRWFSALVAPVVATVRAPIVTVLYNSRRADDPLARGCRRNHPIGMMSGATQRVTFVPMRRDGDPAAPFPFNGTIDMVNVRYAR